MDESLILWDVVEEHLDEAEFLFEMWERAVVAPDYTWRDVERAFGERLRAHLDALAIAGEAAAVKLLVPALKDDEAEPCRAAACALALLEMPGDGNVQRVLQALAASKPGTGLRAGVVRALEVSARGGLDDAVRDEIYAAEDDAQAALLGVLATRRVDPGPIVGTLLRSGDLAVVAAAARAAVMRPAEELWRSVAPLLEAADVGVRMAAVETAMAWGARAGWERCLVEASRGEACAIEWVGMFGREEELALLREAVAKEETRYAALRALGYSGRRWAAEECLRWLGNKDKHTAKLAAEAFGAITGVDAYTDGFRLKDEDEEELPELEEDLAKGLEAEVEEGLPLPDMGAFLRWWEREGGSVGQGRRLRGQPMGSEALVREMSTGTMRRQCSLRAEVRVRSIGEVALRGPRVGGAVERVPEAVGRLSFQRAPLWR